VIDERFEVLSDRTPTLRWVDVVELRQRRELFGVREDILDEYESGLLCENIGYLPRRRVFSVVPPVYRWIVVARVGWHRVVIR